MHNNFVSFLELLRVKHTKNFSTEYYNENPHKQSLLGFSQMLSEYGIKNGATRIDHKEDAISNIETPFLAHFGSDFVVVRTVDSEKVHYLWNEKNVSVSVSEFAQRWSGIILLAEVTPNSIEPNYHEHQKRELLHLLQNSLFLLSGLLFLSI